MKPTDWNKYYQKRSLFSKLSSFICWGKITSFLKEYHLDSCGQQYTVLELGGANSIFYTRLRRLYPSANIILLDKEDCLQAEFKQNIAGDSKLTIVKNDLLSSIAHIPDVDFVFSIGLIEHFSEKDTQKIIARHFEYCKPGGFVLISFPVNTMLYQLTRHTMELVKMWKFYDERALTLSEVEEEMKKYGLKKGEMFDCRLGLTQQVFLFQKSLHTTETNIQ